VAVADVNLDGKLDILVGDFWYEAPDWKMHPIRRAGEFNDAVRVKGFYGNGLSGYSECMCCWADDVNGDGWPDEIVIGFPGKPAYWYENPKGPAGPWKEHVIWNSACNESPQYVDLFGMGKRVLVMGWQPIQKLVPTPESKLESRRFDIQTANNLGQMAWFSAGKDPTQLWEMHPISWPSTPFNEAPGTQRFSHGLGVGDMSGDGRLDVISTGGWWEQPEHGPVATSLWTFHPAKLGVDCSDIIVYKLVSGSLGFPDLLCASAHRFGIWSFSLRGKEKDPIVAKNDLFPQLLSETHAVRCVDMDGDGLKDLVTGKRFWSHGRNEPGSNEPARLYWLKARKSADGFISFTPIEIDNDSGIGTQFEVVDFNGDGRPDIVTSNKKGVYIHLQAPAGL
jgi:hypothetical protein